MQTILKAKKQVFDKKKRTWETGHCHVRNFKPKKIPLFKNIVQCEKSAVNIDFKNDMGKHQLFQWHAWEIPLSCMWCYGTLQFSQTAFIIHFLTITFCLA